MRIVLATIGKTDKGFIAEAINVYTNRLKHYITFELQIIPDLKNTKSLSPDQIKQKEGELLLGTIPKNTDVVLLDEGGKEYTSRSFSKFIEKKTASGSKQLTFVIGGAYGFSDSVYKRFNQKISLSKMTFSHQMVRMIFVEQIYRAFTILKGEPYHHD